MSGGRPEFDVGDLVACVSVGSDLKLPTALGGIYRVAAVYPPELVFAREWAFNAVGDAVPNTARPAADYRRIDSADEAFVQQLRALRPDDARVPA